MAGNRSPHVAARPADIAERLLRVAGGLSFSEVARRTGTNRETARRYMTLGRPSAEFLAHFCAHFSISGTWVLTGIGDPRDDALAALTAHDELPPHPRRPGSRATRSRRSRPASVAVQRVDST